MRSIEGLRLTLSLSGPVCFFVDAYHVIFHAGQQHVYASLMCAIRWVGEVNKTCGAIREVQRAPDSLCGLIYGGGQNRLEWGGEKGAC